MWTLTTLSDENLETLEECLPDCVYCPRRTIRYWSRRQRTVRTRRERLAGRYVFIRELELCRSLLPGGVRVGTVVDRWTVFRVLLMEKSGFWDVNKCRDSTMERGASVHVEVSGVHISGVVESSNRKRVKIQTSDGRVLVVSPEKIVLA